MASDNARVPVAIVSLFLAIPSAMAVHEWSSYEIALDSVTFIIAGALFILTLMAYRKSGKKNLRFVLVAFSLIAAKEAMEIASIIVGIVGHDTMMLLGHFIDFLIMSLLFVQIVKARAS